MFETAVDTAGWATPTATPEEVVALERRVADLVGLLNATTADLVAVVAEALASGAWQQEGIRSPAHWLAWQAGVSLRRARRLVGIARRTGELPCTAAAFTAGSLSEDQVAEIAANVPAARDAELASFACSATVAQLHKVAREHLDPPVLDEPADEDRNAVVFGHGDDGRWRLRADLDPALGALVHKALEACRDAEFHARHPEAAAGSRPVGVTWTDALTRMADAALTGLTGDRPAGERHQVVIHVRASDTATSTHLHLGPALPPQVRRHLTCDATLRYLLEDDDGVPLALGRKQRSVSPQQRMVIEDRDKACRRPGCGQHRWLHIHHLDHWEDGGRTDIDRMCALCPRDHDLHHRGLLGITGDPTRPDGLTFTDRHGQVLPPSARPTPPDRTTGLDARRAQLGIPPARWTHPTGERLQTWAYAGRKR